MTETEVEPTDSPRRGRRKGDTDLVVRRRLAAWLRYEMRNRIISGDVTSIRQFARLFDLSHTHIARVLAEKCPSGLEVLLRLHRRFGHSVNKLLDVDPPAEFFQIGAERPPGSA